MDALIGVEGRKKEVSGERSDGGVVVTADVNVAQIIGRKRSSGEVRMTSTHHILNNILRPCLLLDFFFAKCYCSIFVCI